MADPDPVVRLGGWPPVYAWTRPMLERLRREIATGVIGPDRAAALARIDELLAALDDAR